MSNKTEENITYLSLYHRHPRDEHIQFRPDTHIYTIDGISNYISVTSWNNTHFEIFDSNKIINNMMKSKNWKNSKYYGMSIDDIKSIWDISKNTACSEGTKLHYDIECFYNKCLINNETIEYEYFLKFVSDYNHLKPYRTEWIIYNEDVKISGTIDMTFEDDDGNIIIYDWKRSKEIVKTSNYNRFALTECISHLPDTNFWHYALQLNTYKKILEDKYNKRVVGMFLLCLHPNNTNNSYQKIEIPNLYNEMNELFELRKRQINI